MKFVAFDLETTGTVAGVDRIVEIGAVKYVDGVSHGTFSTLVDPQRSIPPGASAVNGISDDMVQGKPLIETLLEPFADFCEDCPIVAHNAPFDVQFLVAACQRHQVPAPSGVILDTLPMARKVFPGLPNYKLGTLVSHLKIPSGTFHRAEEDASYCGELLLGILKKIFHPGETVILDNLIALTGRPEHRFPVIKRTFQQLNLGL